MKARKRKAQLLIESRNALYNKTIRHNISLSEKNTELSIRINTLENKCKTYEEVTWWQLLWSDIKEFINHFINLFK
jgi:hypothetical protein